MSVDIKVLSLTYSCDKPDVCRGCRYLDADSRDEYSQPVYYCILNLMLPKKAVCKKRKPWRNC